MIFHENCLPSDSSHEILCLIIIFEKTAKFKNDVYGALWERHIGQKSSRFSNVAKWSIDMQSDDLLESDREVMILRFWDWNGRDSFNLCHAEHINSYTFLQFSSCWHSRSNFSRGVQLLIPYRNPYNLWFSRGEGGFRPPVPAM